MDPKLLENLIAATHEVFETMLFMEVEPGEVMEPCEEPIESGVTAQISIAGHLSGVISLHLPSELAISVTNNIAAKNNTEVNTEVCDGVGEVANMIVGNLKTRCSGEKEHFAISIPSVVHGRMHWLAGKGGKSDFPRAIIPFLAAEQVFHIDLLCQPD